MKFVSSGKGVYVVRHTRVTKARYVEFIINYKYQRALNSFFYYKMM